MYDLYCINCWHSLKPCSCGVWWCNGVIHAWNRKSGGSHFCQLGNPELIATEASWQIYSTRFAPAQSSGEARVNDRGV